MKPASSLALAFAGFSGLARGARTDVVAGSAGVMRLAVEPRTGEWKTTLPISVEARRQSSETNASSCTSTWLRFVRRVAIDTLPMMP